MNFDENSKASGLAEADSIFCVAEKGAEIITVFLNGQKIEVSYSDLVNAKDRVVLQQNLALGKVEIVDTTILKGKKYYLAFTHKGDLVLTSKIKKLLGISVKSCFEAAHLKKDTITISHQTYAVSRRGFEIDKAYLTIGKVRVADLTEVAVAKKSFKSFARAAKNMQIKQSTSISFDEVFSDDRIKTSNALRIVLKVGNHRLTYPMKISDKYELSKRNYAPLESLVRNDKAIIFRGNFSGNTFLTKRELEEAEKRFAFKVYESKLVSQFFSQAAKLYRHLHKGKAINIYFEKESRKAEEGTWELFQKARQQSKTSLNFFILEQDTEDYDRLKGEKGLLRKFSFSYYLILYSAHNTISTEVPIHANIKRSKNRYIRLNVLNKNNVFLQHGICYLRNLSKTSIVKNRSGEPNLITVSSEKEKRIAVNHLRLSEDSILMTGLPMFDMADYNSIDVRTIDKIALMLTSRSYEWHLTDSFEQSSYYKSLVRAYEILTGVIDKSKVYIIPHPLAKKQLLNTSLRDSIYDGKVSEILSHCKLMITDYSSIGYNSFYRGAGVLFWQEDLQECENFYGKLIPADNEHIGHRCFSKEELDMHLRAGISDGVIDLEYFRKPEFIKNNQSINKFCDGKNIDRVYAELEKRGIV